MEENINTITTPEETTAEETKTYTQEEVDALLQQEGDRRVSSAEKKYKRTIESLKKQVENEKTLSQLDEEARAVKEKDLRIAELEDRLRTTEIEKNRSEVVKTFVARGLPAELADHVSIGDDIEVALQTVDAVSEIWKNSVAREVKARLAETSAVPQIADAMSGKMTKEQFNKLTLSEQQAMYNSDPELVKNLLG